MLRSRGPQARGTPIKRGNNPWTVVGAGRSAGNAPDPAGSSTDAAPRRSVQLHSCVCAVCVRWAWIACVGLGLSQVFSLVDPTDNSSGAWTRCTHGVTSAKNANLGGRAARRFLSAPSAGSGQGQRAVAQVPLMPAGAHHVVQMTQLGSRSQR